MKNNRTFLEKLLDGAEVEWRTIAEISNKVSSGGTPATSNNSYYENGNIPWLRTQEVDFKEIWDTDIKITEEGLNNSSAKWIPENCVIIAMYGATVGKIAINKIPLTTNQACANIEVNSEIAHYRYVFHYLMSQYEYIKSLGSGSQTNINGQIVKKIKIPIPPLPVQTEIVKILDALTALTSELTSELILRQKQYEYYREKLLSFDSLELSGGVIQWVKLIDLGELIRGNGLQKKDFTETGFPAIHYGQIYTYYGTFATKTKSFVSPELAKKLKKVDCGDVVITNTSENFEDVGKAMVYLGKEQAVTGGHATIFKPNHEKILSKYFVYLTQTSFFTNEKRKYAKGTKVIDVSATDMAKIILPIPPLEKQQRIVSILDKFETLTNSITEGLPLAIEQSQKQYEYYRELLLNFE